MKVAIYARYSTDGQDRTSIDGQIANCEALAGREGLQVVATFHDEGRSGNDDGRAGYQAMLERLKRGEFDGIACDETNRATRNQSELHRLVAELRFRDQFLITCDGIDTRSEASEIVLSVKAAVDAMEGKKSATGRIGACASDTKTVIVLAVVSTAMALHRMATINAVS